MTDTYNQTVGERLRAIRRQKGLSLQEVEALSHQEFKASVLGAYERGERSLSLPRMHRLSAFYGVPVDQLLPQIERGKTAVPSWSSGGVTIDLSKLEKADGTSAAILERFLRAIQIMRQDFNGRVLTIRRSDLQLLAGLLEEDEKALGDMLVNIGAADAGTA
ncbi:MAG: transcriptional regulator [Acidimicrobiia bacterium]|nr:transcriptional regulator [Acidimicrobiia bacterium]MDH3398992.1 transcriptional regulator [Acidimicrobiia bacterium]